MKTDSSRSLELCGYSRAVLGKYYEAMVIVFHDDECGNVACKIPRSVPLYQEMRRGQKYCLLVELVSVERIGANGKVSLNNILVVKDFWEVAG